MPISLILIFVLILQRLGEMHIGKKNLALMSPKLISEVSLKEKKLMLFLHSAWFLSLTIESLIHSHQSLLMPFFLLPLLLLCQFVRLKSLYLLKIYWTPLPVAFSAQPIITTDIYRFCRHPNYLIVMIEFIAFPTLLKCWITLALFAPLNFIFLWQRILREEACLSIHPEYRAYAQRTPAIIPSFKGLK